MFSSVKSLQLQGRLPQNDLVWSFELSFLPSSVDFLVCMCVFMCFHSPRAVLVSLHVLLNFIPARMFVPLCCSSSGTFAQVHMTQRSRVRLTASLPPGPLWKGVGG